MNKSLFTIIASRRIWLKGMIILGLSLLLILIFSPIVNAAGDPAEDTEDVTTQKPASETLNFDPSQNYVYGNLLQLGNNNPVLVTFRLIFYTLSLLGLAFLVILIYAGFIWILAQGNQEKIEKAKKLIQRGVIGFVIIMSSLAISYALFSWIQYATEDGSITVENLLE